MKIGSIVPYTFLPYQSGGQKAIALFYEFLSKNLEIHLVGTTPNDQKQVNGYQLYPLLSSSRLRYINLFLFFRLIKLFRRHNVNIILFEHPYYAWLMWLMKKAGFKVILRAHNIEYERFRTLNKWWWKLLKRYEKFAFKKADIIFFLSNEDMEHAVNEHFIISKKGYVIPFGISECEPSIDRKLARLTIGNKFGINSDAAILLFTGHYNYQPNIDAVQNIITKISPLLKKNWAKPYKIIITGKGLSNSLQAQIRLDQNIIYAGFVDDIETYFKGANILLNNVLTGGGVKTKLIEAIGYGATVISTFTGSLGVDIKVCKDKLFIAKDNDWIEFVDLIIQHTFNSSETDTAFYKEYYWGNIALKAGNIISANA